MGLNGDLVLGGGIARREEVFGLCGFEVVFLPKFLVCCYCGLTVLLGWVVFFSSEQRAVFIRYLILIRKGEVVNSVSLYGRGLEL